MNFYEYHDPAEATDEPAVTTAARSLIANGIQVIPIVKGEKAPANVKDVYNLLSNPIHEKNFDYYFTDRDVDLGMILDEQMEFIDIDEKYKQGIAKSVLKAVEFGWPELYEKLTIHFTASGGCHMIYRSEITGGKQALAKIHHKPNPLPICERISRANSQYIKIPPSAGYTCHQRNPMDIQFITAEERNWLIALASSFNEVHIPEVKQSEAEREDSPWFVFNKQNNWRYIREQLIDRQWKIVQEDDKKVTVNRPGGTGHRSSGYIYKDKSLLYLHTTSSEFENGKAYSPFGVYAMFNHDNNVGHASRQLALEGVGRNNLEDGEFWFKSGKSIQIKYTRLQEWVHAIGYRIFNGSIVQVVNNTVTLSSTSDLKKAFLNEVEFEIKDKMYDRVGKIFSDEGGLMALIEPLEDLFIKDGPEHTWIFFRNIAIKITAEGPEPVSYSELEGYIWASEIIDREFYEHDYTGCDGDRLIQILGGDKSAQLQEVLGYLISRYKDPINARAVILIEDISAEQEGESQGGSGKGLLFQFAKQYRKSTNLDGKNFRANEQFAFQNVDIDTSLIFIDDVDKSFRFNSLFSILTGSLPVNKKNRDQIIIPFDSSPKIGITSNYSIGDMDNSTRRRKYEFAIVKYFGQDREPVDEFGRMFFYDWDRTEWLKFDNLIVNCCKLYLADDSKRKIGNVTGNSSERNLISNTSREFVEYMDDQLMRDFFDFAPLIIKTATVTYPSGETVANAVNMESYRPLADNPDYYFKITKEGLFNKLKPSLYKGMTTNRLTIWLKRWAESRGVTIDPSYKRISDEQRYYRIIHWTSRYYEFIGGTKSGSDPF